jgi:hypothetical protein
VSTQITIPTLNPAGLAKSLDGYKTYIALASGAAVIALNHFGYLPSDMSSQLHLDPANWLNDEYKLLLGATGRSALAKIEAAFFSQGPGVGAKPGGAIGG